MTRQQKSEIALTKHSFASTYSKIVLIVPRFTLEAVAVQGSAVLVSAPWGPAHYRIDLQTIAGST